MIGRTNAGGAGGGIQSTDAILRVIAPAGSTVTISKGGVSKTDLGHENASDHTLYDYYFIVHASQFDSVNPWTVTATLGVQSISETIIINSANEYDVTLLFTLYLIKDGAIQTDALTAVGLKPDSSSSASAVAPGVTYGSTYVQIGWTATGTASAGIAYFSNLIDLSKYSNLHIDGTMRNESSLTTNASINGWTAIGSYQTSNRVFQQPLLGSTPSSYTSFSRNTDISALTNDVYIGFNAARANSFYVSERIANLYLEV